MSDSFTTNLGLTKPEVGASSNTWGGKLNADMDILDGIFTSASTTPVSMVLRDDMKFVNATTTSKQVILSCAGISTSTTRTLTSPDASGTLALQSYVDQSMPTGVVIPWAGASTVAPTGWLLCTGTAVARTTYSTLFSVISTAYGAGDGSTTFNIPDLRGYVAAGKDDMGGSAAGRLSGGTTLGAGLGAQTHSHGGSTMDGPSSVNLAANGLDFNAANVSHTHALHIASDTNVQPTFILNYVIKT